MKHVCGQYNTLIRNREPSLYIKEAASLRSKESTSGYLVNTERNGSHFGHSCGDFHAGGDGLSYEVSRPAEEPPSTGTRYNHNTAIPPHVLMCSVSFHIEILQAKQQEALQQQLEGKRSRIAQDSDEDKAQEQSWGCWFGPLCAFNYDWYAVPSVQQEALQQQLEGKRSWIAQDSDEDKAQEQSWG